MAVSAGASIFPYQVWSRLNNASMGNIAGGSGRQQLQLSMGSASVAAAFQMLAKRWLPPRLLFLSASCPSCCRAATFFGRQFGTVKQVHFQILPQLNHEFPLLFPRACPDDRGPPVEYSKLIVRLFVSAYFGVSSRWS